MKWATAQRNDRDERIKHDYHSRKITWEGYQSAMTDSQEKYMVEERKSIANYKAAIAEWKAKKG